jgi:CDGSH-type Zn-finger protein
MSGRPPPTARIVHGGPLIVEGVVPLTRLERGDGAWVLSSALDTVDAYALCRCGDSTVLPFCDSEEPYGCFDEEAPTAALTKLFAWDLPDGSRPAVALKPDGPLRVAGGVPVRDATSGELIDRGERVSLCRCGASRCQPLCDGSHKVVGFREPR